MRKILLLDTTLRDGEQTPGVNLNIRDKVELPFPPAGGESAP